MAPANPQRADNDDDSQQPAPAGAKKQPIGKGRIENVEYAIWENQSSKGPFYSVTFQHKYKDDEGKTQSSDSFTRQDLLAMPEASRQAYAEIQKLQQKNYEQNRNQSRG